MHLCMEEKDLYWVVGLLEGEGCFLVTQPKFKYKNYFYPRVILHMTDEDVVERYSSLVGTPYYKPKKSRGRKQSYMSVLSGKRAVSFMLSIKDLMGSRRKAKIEEILIKINSTQGL